MAGHELAELEDELSTAAAEERYADAATLKARMLALSERDVAAGVVARMDELLENERCAGAGPLRSALANSALSCRSAMYVLILLTKVVHMSLGG